MKIEDIARLAHNVNYTYCLQLEDLTAKTWDEAPDWQKESAIAGVEFVLKNVRQGVQVAPWSAHISWANQKTKDGWIYGEVKDAEKKTHPCLVPWEQLPAEQKVKDKLFIAVVESCALLYVP